MPEFKPRISRNLREHKIQHPLLIINFNLERSIELNYFSNISLSIYAIIYLHEPYTPVIRILRNLVLNYEHQIIKFIFIKDYQSLILHLTTISDYHLS